MNAMQRVWAAGGIVIGLLSVGACGDDSSSDDGDGAAGSAAGSGGSSAGRGGRGGTSGRGSGGSSGAPIVGPAISSAPPAWVRPDDCGGIGNLCPNLSGCGDRSTCQLEGNVCIPALEPGATSLPAKSAERPYCASYTCMTFEEASCFCTGDAGDANPSCSSPAALAGLCMGQGRSCTDMPCCDELACVDFGTGGAKVCEQACTTGADCETGCCTDLRDTGDLICAEQEACDNPCKKRGEACTQGSMTMPNDCCRGACVESDNPDFAGCRPRCTTDADCPDTGCCTLFTNSTNGFCADAIYCTCGEAGAACGQQGQALCCEGLHCVGNEQMRTCSPECTGPADCPNNCCIQVTGVDFMVCGTPEFCP